MTQIYFVPLPGLPASPPLHNVLEVEKFNPGRTIYAHVHGIIPVLNLHCQCRHMSSAIYGKFAKFSVKLTLLMQIIGLSARSSSSLLWIQMYRLGSSQVDSSCPQDGDQDLRNSFINPATPAFTRPNFGSEDGLGGSIYDPVYYSSLFSDNQDEGFLREV